MKKFVCIFMSLMLMFSLTAQAYAAGTDLNEDYLPLAEANDLLDHIKYPLGYDTIDYACVYLTEDGIELAMLFSADGSPDVRPAEAAARAGRSNEPVYVSADEPYVQRSYYDTELGSVVTERIYTNGNYAEKPSSERSTATPDEPSSRSSGWKSSEKVHPWSGDAETYYYAEGYFEWDGKDVTVSQADGDYDYFPSNMEVIKDGVSINYGGSSTPYAQVTYKINYYNNMQKKSTLSAAVKVTATGSVTRT